MRLGKGTLPHEQRMLEAAPRMMESEDRRPKGKRDKKKSGKKRRRAKPIASGERETKRIGQLEEKRMIQRPLREEFFEKGKTSGVGGRFHRFRILFILFSIVDHVLAQRRDSRLVPLLAPREAEAR